MSLSRVFRTAVAAVFAGVAGAHAQSADTGQPTDTNLPTDISVSADLRERLRDHYIFVFKDDMPSADVRGRAEFLTRQAGGRMRHVFRRSLRGFSARMPEAVAARIAERNPNIAYYVKDAAVYAFIDWRCIFFGICDGGGSADEVTPYGITRVGGPVNGTGLTAWVIDTGIDLDHPDLNVDVARSADFTGSGTANDGNGHGTHVAGTIAAIDNDIDVVGVAAGATVVAVRVLDNRGSGTISDVIAGVEYVAQNAAPGDVANMSLGGGANQALDDAVRNAASLGIKFAIAAGNSGANANNYSPARANGANIWTVSAIDSTDTFASFSNYANPPVDCAAPGVSVQSLDNDGGGIVTYNGTSMAAPHVAGILLFGTPNFSGTANGDPDGNPDPVCVF